jgi:hypothetical protein
MPVLPPAWRVNSLQHDCSYGCVPSVCPSTFTVRMDGSNWLSNVGTRALNYTLSHTPMAVNCDAVSTPTLQLTALSVSATNSTFCPHSVFMCFVWISERTAIISLYSVNCLVFITDTECVHCAVRTESQLQYQSTVSVFKGLSRRFPCQYHSANAPYSSSSTCCS